METKIFILYEIFLYSHKNNLSQHSISPDENGFDRFCHICLDTIKKCAS